MKKSILVAAAVAMISAAISLTTIRAQQSKKEIVGVTKEQVRWFGTVVSSSVRPYQGLK